MTDEPLSDKDGRPTGHDREVRTYVVEYVNGRGHPVETEPIQAHQPETEAGMFQLVRYLLNDVRHRVFVTPAERFVSATSLEDQVSAEWTAAPSGSNTTVSGPTPTEPREPEKPAPQDVPF